MKVLHRFLPVLGAALLASLASIASAQPGAGTPTPTPTPTPVPTAGSGSSTTPAHNEPGPNGPGLGPQRPGDPQGPPQPPPRPVSTAPLVLDARDMEELKDVEAEYTRFIAAAAQHEMRMRAIAKREYDTRTGDLDKRYGDRIAKTEADRGKRHSDTVALLEKFLQNHPSHETFTPDAMFRLADLYLDESDADVEARLVAQEKALKDGTLTPDSGSGSGSGSGATGELAVMADYSKSLALWEDILKRFPSYRQTPSTLYLLAYYGKTRDERKSLEVFLALSCANKYKWDATPPPVPTREQAIKRVESKQLRDPYSDCEAYPNADPELVRHAWVRGIADYHFTVPGELDEGIAAYKKVADNGQDSKLYAESLYKLAWSYYKRDFLKDSIDRFDASVRLYDSIVAAGNQPPLELREESIQYIAVAFTDPWEGEADTDPVKAFDRARSYYKGKENEPHVRDVWVALGHAFGELQAWDQAVDAYRIAIGPPWELDPHNPVVHQEIVNIYEAKGDKFAADQAAAELATKYAPGTAWYQTNEKDREAMDNQRRIAERALYAAAINTNTAAKVQREDYEASSKKDPAVKDGYIALYSKAFQLYGQFLETYPDSDYAYEFNFKMGDALYYSERYLEAAKQYRLVRDSKLGSAHYVEAARSVVNAYEAEAARQVAKGTLAALNVPTSDQLKALPQPLTPQPIPDVYVQLQGEYDNYQKHVPDPAAAPQQGINAALISLAYLHIDDSITRLRSVMDQFCKTPPPDPKDPKSIPLSARAKDGLLSIYEATGNLDAFEATNKAYIANQCGTPATIDIAVSQNRSLNFQRASKLFDEKQYVAAGDAFYKFYKTAPAKDPDLPSALYSSAVSYYLGERPKTAIALFKEFTAAPGKEYRESPYYLEAMRLTAASYQSSFDYDNAVSTFLALYDTARKAKARGAKPPPPMPGAKQMTLDEISLTALYNAAVASELNRDFKKAIDLYGQYDRVETARRPKDRAMWEVAQIYRQSGDVNSMEETLDRWRRFYGKDAGNEDDYVQSFYDTAALYAKKGRNTQAAAAGADTVAAWKTRGSQPKTKGAKFAAEWALAADEAAYKKWDAYQLTQPARTIAEAKAQNATVVKMRDEIQLKFKELEAFGLAEYTMAALVRFGDIEYGFGQKIANAPLPVPVATAGQTDPNIIAAYETARDAALAKNLDNAKAAWVEVDDKAKQGGLSNRWSQLAREELAREFPDKFKALHQEQIQGTDAP